MSDALAPALGEPLAAPGRPPARRTRLDPVLLACCMLAIALALLAVLAPLIAPYDPDAQKLLARLRPPRGFAGANPNYWLGTDQLGRDLFSRCLHGLRLSLALASFGALMGLVVGCALGFVAGLARGWTDAIVMGLVDLKLSLPFTLVALFVIALAGASVPVLVVVLALAYWAHFARLVRGEVLRLRDLPYVEAARASGAGLWRIATRHLIPNIVSPVIVMFTLNVSNLILLESSLSFLGLGVQPPVATLGSMVGQGRDYMATHPWIVATPAILISLVALVVMLLGDALRDRLDVKLRER